MSYASARSPIPCLFLKFVSLLQARCPSGTLASTPGLLGHPVRLFRESDQETSGPPKPVLSLSKGSQATPLIACPALRPRWSPEHSPIALRTAAFHSLDSVGFPALLLAVILSSTTIQISRLYHAACTLAFPGFGRSLPSLPAGFATGLVANL